MRRSSLALFALILSAALVPTLVVVDGIASAQTADERTRARAAYTEGQRRFDAGDFAGALTKFEEAYSIVNNPVVLLGIASAQERLGRAAEARATLERYLRERPTAPDRADVEARIATMPAAAAPATGTVSISSEPSGASIVVDGESSGATTPSEVTLEPGEHTIALALSGYELATETVTVAAGEARPVSVALTAMAEPEPMGEDDVFGSGEPDETDGAAPETPAAPSSDPSAATWVTTAVAGVALVAGTVFGFVALSRQSDFDVTPTRALADEGEAFALGADISFGVAIAAGITAIVLYATDRPSAPAPLATANERAAPRGPSVAFAPMVSPTGGGVAAGVSF